MVERRRNKRVKRRLACRIQTDGRSYNGFVLDLSRTGVFVQTSATLKSGLRAELILLDPSKGEVTVSVTVRRRHAVPPRLAHLARSGLAMDVREPPAAYLELLDPKPERATPPARPTPAIETPTIERLGFRVTAKQRGKPRTRNVEVNAASEADAKAKAIENLGSDWEIVVVEAS